MSASMPHLTVDAPRSPEAVALVLHGGASEGRETVHPLSVAYLRMLPFARSIRRAGKGRIAVARLRHRVRGWNGAEASPVPDAEWALAQLTERFPDLAIGLVGHSMGARTALRVGSHPQVTSVVALAPWLPEGESPARLAGRRVLLVHGTADRTTSPQTTTLYAAQLTSQGVDTTHVQIDGAGHAMLRRAGRWHGLATGFTVRNLLGREAASCEPAREE